jgi:hypothetical protein
MKKSHEMYVLSTGFSTLNKLRTYCTFKKKVNNINDSEITHEMRFLHSEIRLETRSLIE